MSAAVERSRTPWGLAEFFVISQTAIPALLYLPGTQPLRLYIRVASFGISLALLLWWGFGHAKISAKHPAQPWLVATLIYIAAMIVHPFSNSTFAGLAQLVLYLSVAAPLFWASSVVHGPDHLARLVALLLVCNGVNSVVGVLQVYDPARWMPHQMSRLVTESELRARRRLVHGTERPDHPSTRPLRQSRRRRRTRHVRRAARPRLRDQRDRALETRRLRSRRRSPASPPSI